MFLRNTRPIPMLYSIVGLNSLLCKFCSISNRWITDSLNLILRIDHKYLTLFSILENFNGSKIGYDSICRN